MIFYVVFKHFLVFSIFHPFWDDNLTHIFGLAKHHQPDELEIVGLFPNGFRFEEPGVLPEVNGLLRSLCRHLKLGWSRTERERERES